MIKIREYTARMEGQLRHSTGPFHRKTSKAYDRAGRATKRTSRYIRGKFHCGKGITLRTHRTQQYPNVMIQTHSWCKFRIISKALFVCEHRTSDQIRNRETIVFDS